MAKYVCQNILTIFGMTQINYVTLSAVAMATAQVSLTAGNDVPGQKYVEFPFGLRSAAAILLC